MKVEKARLRERRFIDNGKDNFLWDSYVVDMWFEADLRYDNLHVLTYPTEATISKLCANGGKHYTVRLDDLDDIRFVRDALSALLEGSTDPYDGTAPFGPVDN